MATSSLKLGSKSLAGLQRVQAWYCTQGLPSDITIAVEDFEFNLHRFPLISKSAKLRDLITKSVEDGQDEGARVVLDYLPGGKEAFDLAAKFCYGMKLELTASNIVPLRCAAEYLEMTEEMGEGNLIVKADAFLNQVVLRRWKDSLAALASCDRVLEQATKLGVVKKCIDSICSKACTDPALFGWPLRDQHLAVQSPGGSVLWNGISTGARPKNSRLDWWYDDVASLSLSMFRRLVLAMEARGIKPEIIAGAVITYARRYLPGLGKRQMQGAGLHPAATMLSDAESREILETMESLLPPQKGVVPCWFLHEVLRLAIMLNASARCKTKLERRLGMQLDQAGVDDLILTNYSDDMGTLYDVETVQRIVGNFLSIVEQQQQRQLEERSVYEDEEDEEQEDLTPLMSVAKLVDLYLAEVAPDPQLKPAKLEELTQMLPEYARVMDDGLYRAVDIYLKCHPYLDEAQREQLCRAMDCKKLSLEACTHAAQNERLPLRVVVQVLFFEQLQLRTALTGCLVDTGATPADESTARPPAARPRQRHATSSTAAAGEESGWAASVIKENQVMRMDMDRMRSKVQELEKECVQMRKQIERLGGAAAAAEAGGAVRSGAAGLPFPSLVKRLGCRSKAQVWECDAVADKKGGGGRRQQQARQQQELLQQQQARQRHRRSQTLA